VLAAYAARMDRDDPLAGLEIGERPEPEVPEGWTSVTVRAAALNHHDLWSLRGVGLPADRLPMILGCDAAGVDEDGNEVVVHAGASPIPAWRGDETMDPRRSLLSERHPERWPSASRAAAATSCPKPAELSFEEAACLPTAWLTAYRMLFTRAALAPAPRCSCRAPGGGVVHGGDRPGRRGRAAGVGDEPVGGQARARARSSARTPSSSPARGCPSGRRGLETVGAATWSHSIKALRPGGTLVVSGATSGDATPAELTRIYFLQLSVVGSTMGTRDELERLVRFCAGPRHPAAHPRLDAAARRARRVRGDGRRRPVRQGRVHPRRLSGPHTRTFTFGAPAPVRRAGRPDPVQ
jgi:NADPH:quinone reductase-like Zn-dependent oxidoreductase